MKIMQNNVLEYLENVVGKLANKIAYASETRKLVLVRFIRIQGLLVVFFIDRDIIRSHSCIHG